MRIAIHAVGRLKRGPEEALCSRYLDRFAKAGQPHGLVFDGLRETAESKAQDAISRRRAEADRLTRQVESDRRLILLDETGRNIDSRGFTRILVSMRDEGTGGCIFALGGPDGHDSSLFDRAHLKISFGKLTWPHQLARIMLAEQLYRATTILSGHPYHRE